MRSGRGASRSLRTAGSGALCVALLSSAACGGTDPPSASVAILPSPCTIARDGSLQLVADVKMPVGFVMNVTNDPGTQWSSDDTSTVTVSATGAIMGVGVGSANVSASYDGATGTIVCTVGD
jgi:hypothetical protein